MRLIPLIAMVKITNIRVLLKEQQKVKLCTKPKANLAKLTIYHFEIKTI